MLKRILLSLIAIPVFYGLMFAITSKISAEAAMNALGESQAPEEAQRLAANASLVGWWKFENNLLDTSTYNNGGDTISDLLYVDGKYGTALKFDGSNYVEVADDPSLEPEYITLEAWVRSGQTPGTHRYVVSKYLPEKSGSYSSYALYTGGTGGLVFYIGNTSWVKFSSAVTEDKIWDGQWHHVAGTYDGKTIRLYVDGSPVGDDVSVTDTIYYDANTSGHLYIGSYNSSALRFIGDIDNVKIWNRALTEEEISTDLNGSGYTWEHRENEATQYQNQGQNGAQNGTDNEFPTETPVQTKTAAQTGDGGDEVVIESGDKVRGDEGVGDVNQVQNSDCQAWDEWCVDPVETPETEPEESASETPESADVVLESGDMVRGNEGQGSTVQTCDTPDYTGECPYGDYNPTDTESTANGNSAK